MNRVFQRLAAVQPLRLRQLRLILDQGELAPAALLLQLRRRLEPGNARGHRLGRHLRLGPRVIGQGLLLLRHQMILNSESIVGYKKSRGWR